MIRLDSTPASEHARVEGAQAAEGFRRAVHPRVVAAARPRSWTATCARCNASRGSPLARGTQDRRSTRATSRAPSVCNRRHPLRGSDSGPRGCHQLGDARLKARRAGGEDVGARRQVVDECERRHVLRERGRVGERQASAPRVPEHVHRLAPQCRANGVDVERVLSQAIRARIRRHARRAGAALNSRDEGALTTAPSSRLDSEPDDDAQPTTKHAMTAASFTSAPR
jgi:hypothetical protein